MRVSQALHFMYVIYFNGDNSEVLVYVDYCTNNIFFDLCLINFVVKILCGSSNIVYGIAKYISICIDWNVVSEATKAFRDQIMKIRFYLAFKDLHWGYHKVDREILWHLAGIRLAREFGGRC